MSASVPDPAALCELERRLMPAVAARAAGPRAGVPVDPTGESCPPQVGESASLRSMGRPWQHPDMGLDDLEQVLVTSRAELRRWLTRNADTSPSIWLVTYTKSSGRPSPSYDDIVEEALCFGWIDSTVRKRDGESSMLLLASRKPTSTWSASNKARLERLLPSGMVTARGLAAIEVAKANGTWELLDPVERLEVPEDLAAALDADPAARRSFDGLPPGARKQVLWHIVSAKRPETRARRIAKVVADVGADRRPVG